MAGRVIVLRFDGPARLLQDRDRPAGDARLGQFADAVLGLYGAVEHRCQVGALALVQRLDRRGEAAANASRSFPLAKVARSPALTCRRTTLGVVAGRNSVRKGMATVVGFRFWSVPRLIQVSASGPGCPRSM